MQLDINPDDVKGFLHPDEGACLYELGKQAAALGPCLEVGSYCGKSTVYLGSGVRAGGGQLFALDHHRGSEEHQKGEGYHDAELFDVEIERMDSLPTFRRTLFRAGLEGHVIPVVANSAQLGNVWRIPLGMVFIDGGHSFEAAYTDLRAWMGHVLPGGYLAIHDIFASEAEGGQAPRAILEHAEASGLFESRVMTETLGVLRRRAI
ncbi:MAG: class I SAM-dependent methyltransferase [Halioglobus sp.]